MDDVPTDHVPCDPVGSGLRHRPLGRARDRRVRCGERRLGPGRRRDHDADPARAAALRELRPRGRLRGVHPPGRDRVADAPRHDQDQPAPRGTRLVITVRDVTKHFGTFAALDDISLEVPDGSLTALLGPSGSGKSTLLRVIAGLEGPDSGTVEINGQDATGVPPQRRGIGFVFQHYAAFQHMTVRDNVAFGLTVRKLPKAQVAEKVGELLGIVGLSGYQDRYPNQLSGGQRQRMALARALAVEPRVLLLDEPFGALDANVRAELRAWLRRLHDEVHVTTVLVTHDQEEAMEVADVLAVMDGGRIVQTGAPREIYEHPASDFVMRFLGPVARLDGHLVRPHDLLLSSEPHDGAGVEAMVARVVHVGFEVRVELVLPGGEEVSAQLTRAEADELEVKPGDILWLRSAGPAVARVT